MQLNIKFSLLIQRKTQIETVSISKLGDAGQYIQELLEGFTIAGRWAVLAPPQHLFHDPAFTPIWTHGYQRELHAEDGLIGHECLLPLRNCFTEEPDLIKCGWALTLITRPGHLFCPS